MKICVAGVGKPWATDDAVGPTIVRQLASRFEAAPPATGVDLAFTTSSEPAVDLLHLMEGADQVIIIDAVRSGAPPGTIHRQVWLPGLIESRGVERASSHGLGVREILALAAELGRLPDQVFLWGVEVVSTEPGYGLSPPVAAVLPNVVEQFSQILAIYLKAALERGKS
ncbi:MAG: hydrogenase maturation protease [Anaerolineae bacterium]|nr:hydrogenase maturation protease [Anaerolineae bacterium]